MLTTALILYALNGSLVAAQDTRLAITDPRQADRDFAYQGEYLGAAPAGAFGCSHLGLQVVALGQGEFQAVLLRGGLPGAGWDRTSKMQFRGTRRGDELRFANRKCELLVRPGETVLRKHDGCRAWLQKIHRVSPTQDAPPPYGAIVLFDGTSTRNLVDGRINEHGLLEVGVLTRMAVGDFRMHLEFRTPYMPHARGQGRGNSGVYIQRRYEVQILDSFGLAGEANECGGLYKQKPPAVNMCYPPLSWQTYDIDFTAARFDSEGNKITPARISVWHNGQPIHTNYQLTGKTGAGQPEGPQRRPILLQNHRNPVHFRNIWIVLKDDTGREATVESRETRAGERGFRIDSRTGCPWPIASS